MNDKIAFAAYNIVNQIADVYAELIPSDEWVPVRQRTNDELWAFAEHVINKALEESND